MTFYLNARGLTPFHTWRHLQGLDLTRAVAFHLELVETWSTWQQAEMTAGRGGRLTKH